MQDPVQCSASGRGSEQTSLDLITRSVENLKCKQLVYWTTGRDLQHVFWIPTSAQWKMSGLEASRAAGNSVSKGQREAWEI